MADSEEYEVRNWPEEGPLLPLLLKDIYARVLERGHKMTPQRWAIISIFLLNRGRPLSADDVYSGLRESYPNQGIATVYRTLDLLEEIDVLKRIDFGDGRSRYEIKDEENLLRHILVCQQCGEVEEFEDDLLYSLEAAIQKKTGFQITEHAVKFYGLCRSCQAKERDAR